MRARMTLEEHGMAMAHRALLADLKRDAGDSLLTLDREECVRLVVECVE
jgi:hypothetical protein